MFPEKGSPMISTLTATCLSILYTLLYVIPFYLSPHTRPTPTLNRDAPTVIRARVRSVFLASIITSLSTWSLIANSAGTRTDSSGYVIAFHLLGYSPLSPISFSILRPLLLTAVLFLGPLFEKAVTRPPWSSLPSISISTMISDPIWVRNYIAGPVTEEMHFRSVIIPLHLLADLTPTQIVFRTPLYFGIAHIHHLYEFTLTHPHTSIVPALLRSLFQFAYTTVFGWYASFLYLRTGCLALVILVHSFCNWCGLPRLWGWLKLEMDEEDEQERTVIKLVAPTPVTISSVMSSPTDEQLTYTGAASTQLLDTALELPVTVTVVYYLLLVAGAFGFYQLFWTWTESPTTLCPGGLNMRGSRR